MKEVLSALTVLFMSAMKFMFAAPVSYHLGYGFLTTLLLLMIGGGVGMVLFYLAGTRVVEWFRLRRLRKEAKRARNGQPPRRIFTRTNRMIVRIKRDYGMPGLALMPPVLSIPITAVIAAKYFRHDHRTLPVLLAAVVVWSVVLSSAWSFMR